MVKRLPLKDFRSIRMILEPQEYFTGGEMVPPSDQIPAKIWHGIMDLPDDVAVRISDHHGLKFDFLYTLWGEWLTAIGDDHDGLSTTMLDAADCFQASLFDFLHGFYRSSISNLRSSLELVAIGALGNVCPTDDVYLRWKDGAADLAFPSCRKRLHSRLKKGYHGLLDHDGWAIRHYYDMCGYAHSRPKSSDGDLWESNGPVYNGSAIVHVMSKQLLTYACCYLLIKVGRPEFNIPTESIDLFEIEGFPWITDVRQSKAELYPA